jgi:lysophospholipase
MPRDPERGNRPPSRGLSSVRPSCATSSRCQPVSPFKRSNRLGKGRERIPGWKQYAAAPFEENKETHSKARHSIKMAMYGRHPEVCLGGPTNHFVVEMMRLAAAARSSARALTLPVLVLKAEEDSYVGSRALDEFCAALPNGRKVFFEDARREILIETDVIRDRAIAEIRRFISSHDD